MGKENETLRTLMATQLGGIAYLADMAVRVRKTGEAKLCGGCVFSTKDISAKRDRCAQDCPYHRACMSPFRPDRESVVFGKM